jgi:hypothetical protein
MFGPCLDHVWTMRGPVLDHAWAILGPYLGHVWTMFGQCIGHVWVMFGPYLGYVCTMFGPFWDHVLGCVWAMFGLCFCHVWTLFGPGGLTKIRWYIASNSYYWDTAITGGGKSSVEAIPSTTLPTTRANLSCVVINDDRRDYLCQLVFCCRIIMNKFDNTQHMNK